MRAEMGPAGVTLVGPEDRVVVGPGLPGAVVRVGGRTVRWVPDGLRRRGERWVAEGGPGGLTVELSTEEHDGELVLGARPVNTGAAAVALERLVLFSTASVRVGADSRRWRTYRNGYQSWAGTRTLGVEESDRDVPTRLARTGVTDARHRSPGRRGVVRSDALSAVCEPVSGDALAVAFLSEARAFGFVELDAPNGVVGELSLWVDLDGTELAAGAAGVTAEAVVVAAGDRARPAEAGGAALQRVVEVVGARAGALGVGRAHPAGWCSWYYYFTRVDEAAVLENLAVLAEEGRDGPTFGCEYVMVDDGHQSAIGDWLDTRTDRFPSGMASLAGRITAAGFDTGIWWAPFIVAPDSRVARDHPDWLVRNRRGRPIVGLLNPMWSATAPMRVLDTTHPEVLDHVRGVAGTIAGWGYAIQKLDFLFAAALSGVRHDQDATRAVALRRGLEAVRDGAGEDAFLLGCGCPLGPAVGVVDAMRIGADVTPYWSNPIDRWGGRGRHGLATRNAVVNVITRSVLDGRWWLNDPDCLMVRETDTKLTREEVRTLATAIGMTDGMIVLSDKLAAVGPGARGDVARTRELAGGRVRVPDLFERAIPELLVAEHAERCDVGVLNLGDRARRVTLDLDRLGLPAADGDLIEFWTGSAVPVRGGLAHLGELPPHAARVLQVPRPRR